MATVISILRSPAFVPALSVALNVTSAIRYAAAGDWGRCVYWAAAAVLTSSITWWIES